MKYLKYINYVLRHKWYVGVECFKKGLFWRGLVHDLSKFRPSELFPYTNFFFGKHDGMFGKNSPRDKTGYYKPVDTGDSAFDNAWFCHQKRNKHHWQYWTIPDEAKVKPLEIPEKYVDEMMCDWIGAAKAQKAGSIVKWWLANKDKMVYHPDTINYIERKLKRESRFCQTWNGDEK